MDSPVAAVADSAARTARLMGNTLHLLLAVLEVQARASCNPGLEAEAWAPIRQRTKNRTVESAGTTAHTLARSAELAAGSLGTLGASRQASIVVGVVSVRGKGSMKRNLMRWLQNAALQDTAGTAAVAADSSSAVAAGIALALA
jgi:hypothetical protein